MAFLRKHRMAPSNTTILIRGQTICSLFMILHLIFYYLNEDKPIYDFKYAIFVCYFVEYEVVYYVFTNYCIDMMILLSVDRFICIIFPFKYSSLRKVHFYVAIFLVFWISAIFVISYLNATYITTTNIENATTFTCNIKRLDIISHVVLVIFISSPAFIFAILNIVTSLHLWKSIKTRSNLCGNASNKGKGKLSVRFTIANILTTCIVSVIYFIHFIFYLLVWFWLGKNNYIDLFYYNEYIFAFFTVINLSCTLNQIIKYLNK